MSGVRTRPIVFLGADLPNPSTFSRARLSFSLSLFVLSFAIVSLGTGVAAGHSLYAVVGNSAAALFPLLVAQSLRLKLWRADILAVQCAMGTVYMLLIVIMDSIILAFTVTTFRYCYGEWSSRCAPYSGSSGFDLVCTTSETAETNRFVTCSPQLSFTLQFVSLGCNLVHGILAAPYLMACYALKLALKQAEVDNWGEDGDGYMPAVSRPVVILGEPGDPEEVDTVDSVTVHSKPQLDNSFDSHEEYTGTRNLATSLCGLKSN